MACFENSGTLPVSSFNIDGTNIPLFSSAMKFGVLIAVLLACSSVACGQNADTVSSDRPSFSSSTSIVPRGHIQLEGGATRTTISGNSITGNAIAGIRFGGPDDVSGPDSPPGTGNVAQF